LYRGDGTALEAAPRPASLGHAGAIDVGLVDAPIAKTAGPVVGLTQRADTVLVANRLSTIQIVMVESTLIFFSVMKVFDKVEYGEAEMRA
jgi:hypothetical protein